ncbi:hypothetical protein ACWOC1_11835 [Enterococcus quebecensis]|uniref:WxL domain-containing protein n=1 Tax=Enterococcus quebecensis TaxID=903983 RepID=A0A1E5GUQ5_9ENTE|nr:hypothetical protein [Enterococcus quebecensis]OEG16050.1 hypothetical protein BCR23_07845 [Enterococcus quebecensis]
MSKFIHLKRRYKVVVCLCMIFGVAMVFFLTNRSNTNIKAHPVEKSIIDAGTELSVVVPTDSLPIYEPELKLKYPDYFQGESSVINLTKEELYGSSSPINDTVYGAVKTSNGNILEIWSHSTYGLEDPDWMVASEVVLLSKDNQILKRLWIDGKTPDLNSTKNNNEIQKSESSFELIADNKNGTYSIVYSGYVGDEKGPAILTIDNDLNMVSRKIISSENFALEGQTYNRSSTDFDNNIYKTSYIYWRSSEKKNYNVFTVSKDAVYSTLNKLEAMDADDLYSKKLGVPKPISAYDGLAQVTRARNGDFVGVATLGKTDRTVDIPQYSFLNVWDATTGKIKYMYEPSSGDTSISIKSEISDVDNIYFFESSSTKNPLYLKCLDTVTGTVRLVKEYPRGTSPSSFHFSRNEHTGKVVFFGYVSSFTGDFKGYGTEPSVVSGFMDKNFNIESMSAIGTGGERVLPNAIVSMEGDNVHLAGTLQGTQFVSSYPSGGPTTKRVDTKNNIFYGNIKQVADFPPVIRAPKDQLINPNNPIYQIPENVERKLLTGSPTGKFEHSNAVKVYDFYDFNKSMDLKDQQWLNARINRNPQDITQPIDWKALGFDIKKTGPQRVTYFVTDSQKQFSVTSSIVSVLSSNSVYNDKAVMDAHNFAISFEQAQTLTEGMLRRTDDFARLHAWDRIKGNRLSGGVLNVEVDQEDLKRINSASSANPKETQIYDLTFRLKYGAIAGEPMKEIKVKVFVGGEADGDYVFSTSSNNFPIFWDISKSISSDQLLKKEYGNVKAYQISKGTLIDETQNKIKVKDDSLQAFRKAEPVSSAVSQGLILQILAKDNSVLAESKRLDQTVGTIQYRYEDISVSFIDEEGMKLYDENNQDVTTNLVKLPKQIVGKPFIFDKEPKVTTEVDKAVKSQGYEFKGYILDDKTTIYPLAGMEIPYKEGKGWQLYASFKGVLRFISVPKQISFKESRVLAKEQTVLPADNNPAIIIGDNRKAGEKNVKGWQLYARLTKDFTSTTNDKLPNVLYYDQNLLGFKNSLINTNRLQTKSSVNLDSTGHFRLQVPIGTAKKKSYSATIIWELATGP